jgi:hypothetical protein
MTGDARVRFCDHCQLNVYNISELSRVEAEALIASTEGRICARLYRRADGSVLTKDCPVGLRALRMRVSKRAAAVFAAVVSISAAAFGQQASAKQDKKTACVPQMKITSTKAPINQDTTSVAGTVLDAAGALVPNARVSFKKAGADETMTAMTTNEGSFQFESLADGNYSLKIEFPGFKTFAVENMAVEKSKLLSIDVILEPDGQAMMGVIAMDSLIETSNPSIKTTLTGDQLRRLPLPK